MSFEWKKNLKRLTPYVPGEQPGAENIIKLNTNENPYPPSLGVLSAIEHFDTDSYRKYPDPEASVLTGAIARTYSVDADQVFVGVGSDDVLGMSFLTFFNGGDPVLFPDITYSFYEVWGGLYGIPFEKKSLRDDFTIDREDYTGTNGGIVIANPNAPTSISMQLYDIEYIVKNNPSSVVIIDEAYIDFGGETALPLVDRYDNVLVVRTFSKSRSMAGARIGFAVGCKELIGALCTTKFSYNSYTIDSLTIQIGAAVLADDVYFEVIRKKIIETRDWTSEKLKGMGFDVLPSDTNFLFVTKPGINAKAVFEALKKRDIYVRYFDKPRVSDYLRITIGTDEEMKKVIKVLEEIV